MRNLLPANDVRKLLKGTGCQYVLREDKVTRHSPVLSLVIRCRLHPVVTVILAI